MTKSDYHKHVTLWLLVAWVFELHFRKSIGFNGSLRPVFWPNLKMIRQLFFELSRLPQTNKQTNKPTNRQTDASTYLPKTKFWQVTKKWKVTRRVNNCQNHNCLLTFDTMLIDMTGSSVPLYVTHDPHPQNYYLTHSLVWPLFSTVFCPLNPNLQPDSTSDVYFRF